MEFLIQIYRQQGEGFVKQEAIPLATFLRVVFASRLAGRDEEARFLVQLWHVPDTGCNGEPVVYNLLPQYGYSTVRIQVGERLMYTHPHPMDELITRPLQGYLQHRYPGESPWAFALSGPGLPVIGPEVRLTPQVAGAFMTSPTNRRTMPAIQIKRLADPLPPEKSLGDFGVSAPAIAPSGPVHVLLSAALLEDFLEKRRLSDKVEEGGFLLGKVYGDRENPGKYLAELSSAPHADQTGASMLHFTFTGDSFTRIKAWLVTEAPENVILGWYHTHLFSAEDDGMGLSSIDLRLHGSTFQKPWQLAGLLNLDGRTRVLRFYAWQNNMMVPCPYSVIRSQGAQG